MTVNGLPQHIRYNADTVEHLFLPLLRRLTQMQRRAGRRVSTARDREILAPAIFGAARARAR